MVVGVFTFLPLLLTYVFCSKGAVTCKEDLKNEVCNDMLKRMLNTKASGHKDGEGFMRSIPAFGASIDAPRNLAANEVVKFDKVWTNVGKGYNPSTGIFTAPFAGVYFFTCTGMTNSSKTLRLHLIKNSSKIVSLFGQTGYNMGTLSMVLQLKKGDEVYIRHRNIAGENSLYSESISHFSSFSGYLISQ